MENNMNNVPQKPSEKGLGPVIGSAIVIMVVVLGGFYFWGNKLAKEKQSAEIQNQAATASSDVDFEENIINEELSIPNEDLDKLNEEISNIKPQ